jgi:formylglycine-generating enzyme required for sulfatase activity
MARIFISYSRKDIDAANAIAQLLREYEFSVFIDYQEMSANDNFPERLAYEISACDYLLLLLSEDSMASEWVLREVEFADVEKRRIVVVRLDDTKLPRRIFYLTQRDYIAAHELKNSHQFSSATQNKLLRTLGIQTPLPMLSTMLVPISKPPRRLSSVLLIAMFAAILLGGGAFVLNALNVNSAQPTLIPTVTVPQIADLPTSSSASTDTPTLTGSPAPTIDLTAFSNFLTQQAVETATQAADDISATIDAYTDTPTATNTLTYTPTPTSTYTPMPTATLTPREAALIRASAGVSSNDEWTPYIEEVDGVLMALVPIGCFLMGLPSQPSQQCFDEPFWIDVYEVTNAQFAEFDGEASESSRWTDLNRPRENINWFEARDFCVSKRGSGIRLPTEPEWEYAARGVNSFIYPWGNMFEADNVIYEINSGSQTAVVGSRPSGISWVGVFDLSGNVFEWISSMYGYDVNKDFDFSESGDYVFGYPYNPDDGREEYLNDVEYRRGLRGGSWYNNYYDVISWRRGIGDPSGLNEGIGFRCARDI